MSNEKLTVFERTALSLLYRILEKVDGNGNDLINAQILENGFTGKYHEALVRDEEYSPEVCKETSDILQMYRVINNSVAKLSEEELQQLDLQKIEFEGFDNHEEHYHYASFMINDMNLWNEHKNKYIDSHTSFTISKYRKMLNVYKAYYGNPSYDLTFEILQDIINSTQN